MMKNIEADFTFSFFFLRWHGKNARAANAGGGVDHRERLQGDGIAREELM